MSTYTDFIKLQKPDINEKYDINIVNANSDLIDLVLNNIHEKVESLVSVTYTSISEEQINRLFIEPEQ